MISKIKEIVKKVIREAYFGRHSLERIKTRLENIPEEDLSGNIKRIIINNLTKVERIRFPQGKSYAIMVGEFQPNPKSRYFFKTPDGRRYYQILNDAIIKDSTGNQFWAIVRDNMVTTFMLRKDIQTRDPLRNAEKLNVSQSIENIDRFIQNIF